MLWGMTYRIEIHVTKGLSLLKTLLGLTAVYFWGCCHGKLRKAKAMGRLTRGMEEPRHPVSPRLHRRSGGRSFGFFLWPHRAPLGRSKGKAAGHTGSLGSADGTCTCKFALSFPHLLSRSMPQVMGIAYRSFVTETWRWRHRVVTGPAQATQHTAAEAGLELRWLCGIRRSPWQIGQMFLAQVQSLRPCKLCIPNTEEVEAGGAEVQSHPWLHQEFKANLGCLRPSKQNKQAST